jgi:hypothetical protein
MTNIKLNVHIENGPAKKNGRNRYEIIASGIVEISEDNSIIYGLRRAVFENLEDRNILTDMLNGSVPDKQENSIGLHVRLKQIKDYDKQEKGMVIDPNRRIGNFISYQGFSKHAPFDKSKPIDVIVYYDIRSKSQVYKEMSYSSPF